MWLPYRLDWEAMLSSLEFQWVNRPSTAESILLGAPSASSPYWNGWFCTSSVAFPQLWNVAPLASFQWKGSQFADSARCNFTRLTQQRDGQGPILPHSYALTRLIHTWKNQQLIPPCVSSPGSHLHVAELAVDSAMVCPRQARLRLAESVVDSACQAMWHGQTCPHLAELAVDPPGLSTHGRIGCWFHKACPHMAESAADSTRLVHTWQNQLLIPHGLSTHGGIGCWFHQACTPSPSLLVPTEQKQPLK
jgi:hypothetical protein